MQKLIKLLPIRICAVYAFVGIIWIVVTDNILARYINDPSQIIRFETVKDAVFIFVTAFLLCLYIRRRLRLEKELTESKEFLEATVRERTVELRKERDLLDSFINSLPGVSYVVDTEKRLLRWNRAFEQITGRTPAKLEHFDPSMVFRAEEFPIIEAGMKRVFAEGSATVDVNFADRAGRVTPHMFTGVRAEVDGKICMVGVGIDITQRKYAEELLDGQKQVLEMIARGTALNITLDTLVWLIEKQCPDMQCSILLLDADGTHMRHGASPSLPEEFTRAIDGAAIGSCAGSCGTAAFRRKAVVVEDIALDPLWADWRAMALKHGFRACWSTPIFDREYTVLGTFAMYFREPARPKDHHLKLIELATHTAAIAIIRQREEAALRESELRHRLIGEIIEASAYAYRVDAGGSIQIEWATRSLSHIIGYTEAELKGGISFRSRIHPDDRAGQQAVLDRVLTGRSEVMEFRFQTKSGAYRWLQCYNRPEWSQTERRVVWIYGASRDITEQKIATEHIRESNERLQSLSRRLIELQEVERRHLARELHDEIGQTLTAAKINLQSLGQQSDITPRVSDTVLLIDKLLQTVRDLSLNLRPPMLDDLGLEAALRWLLDQHGRSTGRQVRFENDFAGKRLDAILETTCFRVTQEALTNVSRHSSARNVNVELRCIDNRLQLRVTDNGVGFDVATTQIRAAQGSSLGLLGMEERVTLAGGKLSVTSSHSDGTKVQAMFPLKYAPKKEES